MILFSSVRDELVKIARLPPDLVASTHVTDPSPNWKKFEQDLKKPSMQKAFLSAVKHRGVDIKLRRYVRNLVSYHASKDVVAEVQSRTDPKEWYVLKRLPDGRIACQCGDWQYTHSVKKTDCDHIKAAKRSGELQN